jgi:hypothetical protein
LRAGTACVMGSGSHGTQSSSSWQGVFSPHSEVSYPPRPQRVNESSRTARSMHASAMRSKTGRRLRVAAPQARCAACRLGTASLAELPREPTLMPNIHQPRPRIRARCPTPRKLQSSRIQCGPSTVRLTGPKPTSPHGISGHCAPQLSRTPATSPHRRTKRILPTALLRRLTPRLQQARARHQIDNPLRSRCRHIQPIKSHPCRASSGLDVVIEYSTTGTSCP